MTTCHHIFQSLKSTADRIKTQSTHHIQNKKIPGSETLVSASSNPRPTEYSQHLEYALLQGVRSGSATVVRTILEHYKIPPVIPSPASPLSFDSIAFGGRSTEAAAIGIEGERRGKGRGSVRGSTGITNSSSMALQSDHLLSSITAAAAMGSLPIMRILIEYFKTIIRLSEINVGNKNLSNSKLNGQTRRNSNENEVHGSAFHSPRSSHSSSTKRLRWSVIHAVLTGCENEQEARKYETLRSAAYDIEATYKNDNDDDGIDGVVEEGNSGTGRDVAENEIKGVEELPNTESTTEEGRRCRPSRPASVYCVGDLWTLNSIPRGGKRVGGSRERGKILDILLELFLSLRNRGSDVVLFQAEDLGRELRPKGIFSPSSTPSSSTPLSEWIPSCLDMAASSGYWPAVRLMLKLGALTGMQSDTKTNQQSSGQTEGQLSGGFRFHCLLHCAALDRRGEIFGNKDTEIE